VISVVESKVPERQSGGASTEINGACVKTGLNMVYFFSGAVMDRSGSADAARMIADKNVRELTFSVPATLLLDLIDSVISSWPTLPTVILKNDLRGSRISYYSLLVKA